MSSVFWFIVVLGILVFVHEGGHFIVAKLSGIKVETFSLGFGPRLFGFKKGETDYRVSAFPLGGYVKMLGETLDDDGADDPRSLSSQSIWVRTKVVLAGPLMNLVLAFLIMPISYMIGVKSPAFLDKPAIIGTVIENSPADKSGIKPLDEIIKVNDTEIKNWSDFSKILSFDAGKNVQIQLKRGNNVELIKFLLPESPKLDSLGVLYIQPPIVGKVLKDYPAAKAGIKEGDKIVEINNKEIISWFSIGSVLKEAESDVIVKVKRGDKILSFTLIPKVTKDGKKVGIVASDDIVIKKYSFLDSIVKGTEKSISLIGLTFDVVGKLFSGNLSLKVLGGPIQIAVVTGQAAEKGYGELILLMAFISIQLGILNLLPIPVLDGGFLLFFLIEAIRKKPLSEKTMAGLMNLGFVLLLLLTIVVTKNDILRFWKG